MRRLVPLAFVIACTAEPGPPDTRPSPDTHNGVLRGHVVTFDGTAVVDAAGARITFAGTPITFLAGADGRFAITSLPEGDWQIVASKGALSHLHPPLHAGGAAAEVDAGTLQLTTAAALHGTVTKAGAPVPDAVVGVEGLGRTVTGANGTYTFPALAAADASSTYRVLASGGLFAKTASVTVLPGEDKQLDLALDAAPTAVVRGTIHTLPGGTFDDLHVILGDGALTVPVQPDGRFAFDAVPPGLYSVRARGKLAGERPFTLVNGDTDLGAMFVFPITADCGLPGSANGDGDALADACDNCPDLANDQNDSDLDGIGDLCDTPPDVTAPTLVSHVPLANATDVAADAVITITFSEPVAPASFDGISFSVGLFEHGVDGALTFADKTVTFTPSPPLKLGKTYDVTLGTGITDLAGNHLDTDATWSFHTAPPPLFTAASTIPDQDERNVASTTLIKLEFTDVVDPASLDDTTVALSDVNGPLDQDLAILPDGKTVTVEALDGLYEGGHFFVNVSGLKALSDARPVEPFTLEFYGVDVIAPELLTLSPVDGDATVALDAGIAVEFKEDVNPLAIEIALDEWCPGDPGATPFAVTPVVSGALVTFDHAGGLTYGCEYTASVDGIVDLSGNPGLPFAWTFRARLADNNANPGVKRTVPARLAQRVTPGDDIDVVFTEPITPASALASAEVRVNGTIVPIAASFQFDDLTLGHAPFPLGATIDVFIDGIRDADGHTIFNPDGGSGSYSMRYYIDCAPCTGTDTCGGAGIPGKCGTACTPVTSCGSGKNCGTIPNGCGGTVSCGPATCAAGAVCGATTPNVCACPTSCADLFASCGTLPDGCGGTLDCGTCPGGETCGGFGIANTCGKPTCSAGGWCWSSPSTFGSDIIGIEASGFTDVTMAASPGIIAHFDGKSWSTTPRPLTETYSALYRDPAGALYLGGANGLLLRNAGTGWAAETLPSAFQTRTITAIGGISADDLWASAYDGSFLQTTNGNLMRRQSGTWTTPAQQLSQPVLAFAGTAATGLWAAGYGNSIDGFDGTAWSQKVLFSSASERVFGLVVRSAQEVWAAASNGGLAYVRKWDGNLVSTGPSGFATGSFGMRASATEIWSLHDRGAVQQYDGATWKQKTASYDFTTDRITGAWPYAPNRAIAVGNKGRVLRFDASTAPTRIGGGTSYDLGEGFRRGPNDIWVVGSNVRMHWDGTAWTATTTNLTYTDLWSSGPDDAWAVGGTGAAATNLSHWNGSTWTAWTASVPRLFDIAGSQPDDAYAVGSGVVLKWDGITWTDITTATGAGIWLTVGTSAPGNVMILGSGPVAKLWNGATWATITPPAQSVSAVAVVSSTEAWAVGASGYVTRWNGSTWATQTVPTTQSLIGIRYVSPTSIFAMGNNGTLLEFNGTTWTARDTGTIYPLKGMIQDGTRVWLTGSGGNILYHP